MDNKDNEMAKLAGNEGFVSMDRILELQDEAKSRAAGAAKGGENNINGSVLAPTTSTATASGSAQPDGDFLRNLQNALTLAMAICDATPTRAHDLAEDRDLKHIGALVNGDVSTGRHGYAVIRDALAEVSAYLAGKPQIAKAQVLPEGWVPLSIVCNDDMEYPEEVAYGPPHLMNRLGKWLDKFLAQEIAMRDGMVLAPHFRGYAHLGIGAYVLNHSAKGEDAELVISVATEEEKAGRTVGDSRDNAPDAVVQPEAMAVRLRFENVAGLDALEQQLRHVRAEHFPESLSAASAQASQAAASEAAKEPKLYEKNATLKLTLRANSGYMADETHRISADQWGRIVKIANEKDLCTNPATPASKGDS